MSSGCHGEQELLKSQAAKQLLACDKGLGSGVAIHSHGGRRLVVANACPGPAFALLAQHARDAH